MLEIVPRVKRQGAVFRLTRDTKCLNWWQSFLFWQVFRRFALFCYHLGLPTIIDKKGARLEVESVTTNNATAAAIVGSIPGEAFYVPDIPVDLREADGVVVFDGNRAPYTPGVHAVRTNGKKSHVLCPVTHELCHVSQGVLKGMVEQSQQIASGLESLKARI